MAEILSPGVYVIEESSGIKPIEGVGTSTAAFIGLAVRGPVDTPQLITNFSQFQTVFGGFNNDFRLSIAVYQFFQEGGKRCYVTRTVVHDPDNLYKKTSESADGTPSDSNLTNIKIKAVSDGTWANTIVDSGAVASGLEVEFYKATLGSPVDGYFKLDVYYTTFGGSRELVESYDEQTVDSIQDTVSKLSNYISIPEEPTDFADFSIPDPELDDFVPVTFSFGGGNDGLQKTDPTDPSKIIDIALSVTDFYGFAASAEVDKSFGFHSFDIVDEINIIAVPDAESADEFDDEYIANIINKGLLYCESRGDCFYLADPPSSCAKPSQVKTFKSSVSNSTYGALYYPWIKMNHPKSGKSLTMPCSGAIAGIYARSDNEVGVHKAPAGHATGTVNSATGVTYEVSAGEHDVLNPNGINVIRSFSNYGMVVWGARTLTTDAEWKYVNVRRLFLYVEESIDEGTQWVVFEPNSQELWGSVKRNLTDFLMNLWRSGALFGSTPDEAFYVKVDEENNPQAERDAGRLNIEVGIAPVKPAEFVIIRISQKTSTQ